MSIYVFFIINIEKAIVKAIEKAIVKTIAVYCQGLSYIYITVMVT